MQAVWTEKRLPMGAKETARKLQLFREATDNLGKFVAAQRTIFKVQKAEIICPKKALVILPEGNDRIEGISIVSQSVFKSNPLTVEVKGERLMQDPEKIYKLFIEGEGMISIRVKDEPDQTEQPKNVRKKYLVLNSADGTEFLQKEFQIATKQGAFIIFN